MRDYVYSIPVKRLAFILWADESALEGALERLVGFWGPVEFHGKDHPFDVTDYYEPEMGANLMRRVVSFQYLAPSTELVRQKYAARRTEDAFRRGGKRTVNIDPGYLDDHKVVLASDKPAGQKIHLGCGVYADLVSRYRRGGYEYFEWTFPDFKDRRYESELLAIRSRYLKQLREWRSLAEEI